MASAESGLVPNPLNVAVRDREFLWNTIVDTVDDYFDIAQEQRMQLIGDVLTEGEIITQAQPGATIFESWRKDSTPGFEEWQSTWQSIRRRAEIRVAPAQSGYAIHVAVYKALEDVDRPENSTVGYTLSRHNNSLVRRSTTHLPGSTHLGWIPIGRDVSLEQTILADIQTRFQTWEPPPDIQLLPPTRH
jgi:hypothetical protein